MFGQRMKAAESLVAHYEALFTAIGFDPTQAKEGDTDALKSFVEGKFGGGGGDDGELIGALQNAGVEVEDDAKPEAVGAATAEALTAAEAKGSRTAAQAHLKTLGEAGIKVGADAKAEDVKTALSAKISAEVAAKIAANGHKEPIGQPAGDEGDEPTNQAEFAEAINAEKDPVKKQALYRGYAKKFLPALN